MEIADILANKRVEYVTRGRTLVSVPRTTKGNADMTILKTNVVFHPAPMVLAKEEVPEVQVREKAKEKEKERKGNVTSRQKEQRARKRFLAGSILEQNVTKATTASSATSRKNSRNSRTRRRIFNRAGP